ncbi:hypothetical protein ACM66B_002962 [Microbotryomycetes sp. NB124-2]
MLDYMSYSHFSPVEFDLTEPLWLSQNHANAHKNQSRSQSQASSSASSSSADSLHEAQTPSHSPSPLPAHVTTAAGSQSHTWADEVADYHDNVLKRKLPPMPPATVQLPLPSVELASVSLPRSQVQPQAITSAATRSSDRTQPSSAPQEPSREWEEARRGRSRWPRLLWRSDVDEEALDILDAYHQRAVGTNLPILKPRSAPRVVKQWSDSMERAGL